MQRSYQGGDEQHKSLAQRSSLGALDAIQHRDFANGFLRETLTLCDRNIKNIWRNPELFVARIVLMVRFNAPEFWWVHETLCENH